MLRYWPCVLIAAGATCLGLAGCLQVPYVFPELGYAPSVDAKCKKDEVFAFRVDVTQTSEVIQGVAYSRGEVVDRLELSHIPVASDGSTSTQMSVTFASGWRYFGFVNFVPSSTAHAMGLRFYRPGYETIVIKPGETTRELNWKRAADLNAQVQAVDDLVQGTPTQKSTAITIRQVLEPGAKSPAHKEAILFAAGEYERLARAVSSSDPQDTQIRSRLLDSANRMRNLADGKKNGD
jgi:hypothetical protein